MEILFKILVYGGITFLICSALGVLAITYEWLRNESGWFKPEYTVEYCNKHIDYFRNEFEASKNDKNLSYNISCYDWLQYWRQELAKSEKWYKKH